MHDTNKNAFVKYRAITSIGECDMTATQKMFVEFLDKLGKRTGQTSLIEAVKDGYNAYLETVNHEGKWSPSTTREILANTPVCPDCNGEGVTSPGVVCKTCGGTGRIMSDRLRRLYSNLCEKEYYEEEERKEAERFDDGHDELHKWV